MCVFLLHCSLAILSFCSCAVSLFPRFCSSRAHGWLERAGASETPSAWEPARVGGRSSFWVVLQARLVCIIFTNMSTTGDNNNTGDKEKEPPVNTNRGNTASNSSGGPFSGYNVSLLPFVLRFLQPSVAILLRSLVYVDAYSILSMLILYTSSNVTRSTQITNIMFIVLKFWIKICRIMTKFSTIQKLDRSFSVVGFAASLKPHAFDG